MCQNNNLKINLWKQVENENLLSFSDCIAISSIFLLTLPCAFGTFSVIFLGTMYTQKKVMNYTDMFIRFFEFWNITDMDSEKRLL